MTESGTKHRADARPAPPALAGPPQRPLLPILLDRLGPALALVLIFIFFTLITEEGFASIDNIKMMLRQTAIVGTAALGATLIIILGGIDLSVGSVIALASVVTALVLQLGSDAAVHMGYAPTDPLFVAALATAAAAAGIATGAIAGLLNGSLITSLQIVPFIVTLGTLAALRGLAKQLGNNQPIGPPLDSLGWLNGLVASLHEGNRWMILPPGVWIMLGMALLMALLLRYTRVGRYIYAIGSNEQTAQLCGVPVVRTKLIVYTLGGFFAGLAGIMMFSRLQVGDPTVAFGAELDVIAAVVIGGGSLAGGQGSIAGTLVGALIMTVIDTGSTHAGWSNSVQEIITGVIIIVAVALDRLRHRRLPT